MTAVTGDGTEQVDLAVVAYVDEGDWCLQQMRPTVLESVHTIVHELQRYPGETGALAMLSVDEDFLLLVRTRGPEVTVLLSDAGAATDWPLARSVVDQLGVPVPDEDEEVPAGDLGIVEDYGLPAAEMGELLDDYDLYPDEVLSEIAGTIGFGDRFDEIAGLTDA
ncbi:MAG: tRNA adenosine deaminase-associated protein [Marmoricola sp.]